MKEALRTITKGCASVIGIVLAVNAMAALVYFSVAWTFYFLKIIIP